MSRRSSGWGAVAVTLIGGVATAAVMFASSRKASAAPAPSGRGGRFGASSPPARPVPAPAPAPAPPVYHPDHDHPSGTPVSDAKYTLAFWTPYIQERIAGFPAIAAKMGIGALPFTVEWMNIESAGNVCTIGRIDQTAADGSNPYPRELGIGQAYNPDDLKRVGVSAAALRAYCQPPSVMQQLAQQYAQAAAAKDTATMHQVMVKAQSRTRDLTADEQNQQIDATLLAKIAQSIPVADTVTKTYSLTWSSVDWWKLVKAYHAYPRLILDNPEAYGLGGMHAVVQKLGRAPASWAEFRQTLGMDHDPTWNSALNACEACGNATAPAVA
jgi:hypothetical protein